MPATKSPEPPLPGGLCGCGGGGGVSLGGGGVGLLGAFGEVEPKLELPPGRPIIPPLFGRPLLILFPPLLRDGECPPNGLLPPLPGLPNITSSFIIFVKRNKISKAVYRIAIINM